MYVQFNHRIYLCYSKDNLRIVIPITIGTHGIRIDDDPIDEIAHRPLYQRMSSDTEPPIHIAVEDDGDEMGEIDHSLFETGKK